MAGRNSKNSGSAAGVTSDEARSPGAREVRNVALVGHTGAGKTTLVEALLATSGVVSRPGRVEDGTTICDYDEIETRQQRSVNLALAPLEYDGVKINVIDTPGYADFVGDLRAGLRAADCALFVVSTAAPLDGTTRLLWTECAAVGMPRAVVLTKLDHQRADYPGTLAACRESFGDNVLPIYLPDPDTGTASGLVGMLSRQLYTYSDGRRSEGQLDDAGHARVERARGELIEGIIEESEDETLMERYLAGEEIDLKVLIGDLERAVARGAFHPVLPVCAPTALGTVELLELMSGAFPSPAEHPLPEVTTVAGKTRTDLSCDPDGPLLAEVVKSTTDPYIGRLSMVRVFSGTLRPDMSVHVSGHFLAERGHEEHDEDERVGSLSSPLGKTQRPIPKAPAGEIVTVGKLSRAETGDTLSDPGDPLLMRPWDIPEPMLPVAITPRTKADEDKLSQGLSRVAAEDPTLRVENNPETHQLVLWTMGEAHTDVLLDRLAHRYGVHVDPIELRVPLRETLSGPGSGRGKHVKQSGGHGQYGICEIQVEPLPQGSGFEFVDKIVGGAIPRQFIGSVEKGIRNQMEKGTTSAGYPMVDIRVTLVDGKAHSVDSSDMAFQMAGALALREAAQAAGVALLEPFDEVSILAGDDDVGTVMSDLSARRGQVLGTEAIGQGRSLVRAEVPQTELVRYAVDLRAMTHGTASFTRTFSRYAPMPQHLAAKVLDHHPSP
ncbi:elongation factor G-like protein EF-G2 [Actinobacteria bacterium YIM 96077]|uniref:Elongation factor G-like protein n=1 Tax=Phytoactinopolyspora halophila TaxID=1981511 RepID=A0A329QYZ1_9ACTN|nr:elongation factor G-like protein EF-G2 [Phytoactinopolyspora halophila]AYY13328.1 elongation factor G-like protein EF-G2 [Actinobacteria bacterium YIM 96077]RAW17437.1 elongation factor G-like protein EF-G2 [Phytoactinopolyspora halophila]